MRRSKYGNKRIFFMGRWFDSIRLKTEAGYDDYNPGKAEDILQYLIPAIDSAPTIEAEPVRHGHWIHTNVKNVFGGHQHKCSMCGYSLMVSPMCDNENYCCSCGAKMDDVSE